MPRFAEVAHDEWIAAPEALVRRQFADLRHHIDAGVHAGLRLEILEDSPRGPRYRQQVRLLGLPQRDVFERRFEPDGSMVDTSVEGFNRGGALVFRFRPEARDGVAGTCVSITVRLPLPPLVGGPLRRLLEAHVRREVAAAAAEDKTDLEVHGYPRVPALRPQAA